MGPLATKVAQNRRESEELDRALESWATVERRLGGLHPYLVAKQRLMEIEGQHGGKEGAQNQREVELALAHLAESLSLSVDQLVDVARAANEPIRVVAALQG